MKASVVVVDYKRKKYILDALQSIKNQKGIDLNDIEVIVVKYYQDEKIDNYIKENFPNYKIINLDPDDPDHYVGRTFSEGIKAASNNLIFLLEDDDMFTENKISRIFEVVKNIKYDEYLIWNKAILIDESGKPLKELRHRYIYNSSSIVLNIKDKDKLIYHVRKMYFSVDSFLLCYFNRNKKVIKLNKPLTYIRKNQESITRGKRNRQMLEMGLHDHQYIYDKTKCKNRIPFIVIYKIQLNLLYNANYKISLREYIKSLLIFDFDKNYIKRLLIIILYKLFKNYLKKYYSEKHIYTDLNIQNA
jgi:hypothetical protein